MQITIKNKKIKLNPEDVKLAKQMVLTFLKNVRSTSDDIGRPDFYLVMLVVMQVISQDALDMMEPEMLSIILSGVASEMERRES